MLLRNHKEEKIHRQHRAVVIKQQIPIYEDLPGPPPTHLRL